MKARIPNEYRGGPANMQGMIKKMQEDMARVQAELEEKEYEVKAGGGVVTVKMNGKKQVVSIDIAPEIVDPDDIETLSDIIVAAVNEAIKTVEDDAAEQMGKVTGGLGGMMGGLGIPGMPGVF